MNTSKTKMTKFEDLKTSTRTIMVYTNITFNSTEFFSQLDYTAIEAPLTRKKKNIDKKKLVAPYGSIIGLYWGPYVRGLDIRKIKKQICPFCNITRMVNDETEVKVATLEPFLDSSITDSNLPSDTLEVKYKGTCCGRVYNWKHLAKLTSFLNQITVVFSLGHINLNLMFFKDKIKIAGCKNNDDATEAIMLLWEYHLMNKKDVWTSKNNKKVEFLFDLVMRNVDFKLNFPIDRTSLNNLMNSEEYSEYVYLSQAEGHTNVNIKMYAGTGTDNLYECLVYPKKGKPYREDREDNPYKTKKGKKPYTTFIVFSSSEVILSGRYENNMKKMYEFFVTEVTKHRDEIEEKIITPEGTLTTILNKIK